MSDSFQDRVAPWMEACFGPEIAGDREERNHRFIEEALELVQAAGCTASEAHQLVDYVYGRPTGELNQEVGGVMVTLAALCLAHGADMHDAGETELRRIWTKVDVIRAKQAAKPKHSPLPQYGAMNDMARIVSDPELGRLLKEAAKRPMTPGEVWDQRVSWAYGQGFGNIYGLTKQDVARVATEIYGPRPSE